MKLLKLDVLYMISLSESSVASLFKNLIILPRNIMATTTDFDFLYKSIP